MLQGTGKLGADAPGHINKVQICKSVLSRTLETKRYFLKQ